MNATPTNHPPMNRRTVSPTPKASRMTEAEMIARVRKMSGGPYYKVQSFSHPEACHSVRLDNLSSGEWICSCPATAGTCWHLRAVKAWIADIDTDFDPFADQCPPSTAAPVITSANVAPGCAVPVVDPDDCDPFAAVETVNLTPVEVVAIRPRLMVPVVRWIAPPHFYADFSALCDSMS